MQCTQQQDIKSCCPCQSKILVEDARRRDRDDSSCTSIRFRISVTLTFIVSLGRFGLREHTILSPWGSIRTSQSYLSHTSCGDLAHTQRSSRALGTILVKVSPLLLVLQPLRHKTKSQMQTLGNCVWFWPPKEALLRWTAMDFPEFSKMFIFLLYFSSLSLEAPLPQTVNSSLSP